MEIKEKSYISLLRSNALFFGFTEDEIRKTLEILNAQLKTFKKDEFVYHEGARNVKAAIVMEGSLHIIKEDFWGNRSILAEIGKGDMFAETYSCIGSEPLSVSVEAREASSCLFLNLGQIAEGESGAINAGLASNVIKILAEKNLMLTKKVQHLSQRSTRQKILSYLSEVQKQRGTARFEIPFNRQQLADYLSVDRSAMSSELSKLRDEGIIEYRKNRFYLKTSIK